MLTSLFAAMVNWRSETLDPLLFQKSREAVAVVESQMLRCPDH
jgi:hypothetical protein